MTKAAVVRRAPKARVAAKNADPIVIAQVKIGAKLAGGICLGGFFLGVAPYALIAAPRKEGEFADVQWLDRYEKVAGTDSAFDGLANTEAMAAAGSELAKKLRGALEIGGFDDWYLMSRGEALIASAAAIKGDDAFQPRWYWTSTQYASFRSYAWMQDFSDGSQDYHDKDIRCFARAVRRVPIQF